MTAFPCWKDTEITLYSTASTSFSYIDYKLINDDTDEVFFSGRAYVLPNETSATFNINKVVQTYLKSTYTPEYQGKWFHDSNASLRFSVYVDGGSQGSFLTWLDYSYEDTEIAPTMLLNSPVKGIYDVDGKCIVSIVNTAQTASNVQIMVNSTTIHNGIVQGIGVWHFEIKESDMKEGTLTVIVGDTSTTYKIMTTCKDYELIYKNRKGGYDVFTIEGNDKQTDNWTAYTINKSFRNTTLEFEQSSYLLDMQEKYVLYTGWLNDEQSERMKNVFQSTKMFMLNHSTGDIIPVVITDTQMDHLTFANNGCNKIQFTINVKASQSKVIR